MQKKTNPRRRPATLVNAAECAKCPAMALEKLIVDDGGESR